MRYIGSLLAASALAAHPALAGDEVLYDDPPNWVDLRALDTSEREGKPILLADQQARIESGRLWTYVETAVALDSPEALTRFGTVSAFSLFGAPRKSGEC